jgi:hypothetical protein
VAHVFEEGEVDDFFVEAVAEDGEGDVAEDCKDEDDGEVDCFTSVR